VSEGSLVLLCGQETVIVVLIVVLILGHCLLMHGELYVVTGAHVSNLVPRLW